MEGPTKTKREESRESSVRSKKKGEEREKERERREREREKRRRGEREQRATDGEEGETHLGESIDRNRLRWGESETEKDNGEKRRGRE
jgi:hypothetical protein